jgi:hypothetical protein
VDYPYSVDNLSHPAIATIYKRQKADNPKVASQLFQLNE